MIPVPPEKGPVIVCRKINKFWGNLFYLLTPAERHGDKSAIANVSLLFIIFLILKMIGFYGVTFELSSD